jgi:predicted enzyme related to lactoylglutathione lyase
MTTRDTNWPEGTPCWVDLGVDDFDRAKEFYSRLFGWQVEQGPAEFGGYTSATRDGRAVAGLAPKMDPGQPTAWTTYLASGDVEATLRRVTEAGGTVVMDAMPVADFGTMALVSDPGGAVVGFWQGRSHTGFRLANEPGSVTWTENFSRAWRQNKDFYAAVLGWEYDDMSSDDFEYAAFKVGGQVAGGIGQIGADMPSDIGASTSRSPTSMQP